MFTLLHNLRNTHKNFVSSTLQNIWDTEQDLNEIISQLLNKKHWQATTGKVTALHWKEKSITTIASAITTSKLIVSNFI